ncbi:uncharacterized protein SOCE836_012670 [Sorangium cellulosum]|uniref:Uncharacterized protein n=1 Tax=Sorangium cellulosum TaxID=56 RepID=A0A4P2QH22_SORCE|nr:uncharacterized protein SOCE836_012670 [Sorangium cellulosum]WCQ88571.1 hypothetical protein NQZ70_01250 [Sorangium sp. Soce836]
MNRGGGASSLREEPRSAQRPCAAARPPRLAGPSLRVARYGQAAFAISTSSMFQLDTVSTKESRPIS